MVAQLVVIALATLAGADGPGADDPAGAEFFEKEVRPLLAGRCLACHGPEKHKGDLRLDARSTALAGGGSGPAVVPGKPDESLLVDAINYGDIAKMPPKSKLPDAEIATLTKWIAMGAPWPGGQVPAPAASAPTAAKAFNLKERAKFWSFQPLRAGEPPAVHRADWPRTDVDRFLLAELEAKGLAPAPDADKRTLIRRVTFDLTGLPPTPAEVDAFLADAASNAFETVVDRLLASPRYGERWGRHWLDLVRFAETSGHEFDYDIPGAFRYRDYVIRAFNADVPFDRFLVEHVAGDLLETPRRDPADGSNESIKGTAFFALGDGTHSPVDVREEELRRVDNQIDVLSKAFLGLTVACARCHDHKFDPISTKDYYALAGYLRSSRFQLAFLDAPARIDAKVAELGALKPTLKSPPAGPRTDVAAYLLATRDLLRDPGASPGKVAEARGLYEATLARWVAAVRDPEAVQPGQPLHAWATLAGTPGEPERIAAIRRETAPKPHDSTLFEDFDRPAYEGWSASGQAFGSGPSRVGDLRLQGDRVAIVPAGMAHSGLTSDRLAGVLRSRSFTLDRRFLHYRAAGREGRIRLVVDGFQKIRDPIYGSLTVVVNHGDAPRWYTQDVSMWLGQRAYLELVDGAVADYNGGQTVVLPADGYLAVDEIRTSDQGGPPPPSAAFAAEVLDGVDSIEALARRYGALVDEALDRWRSGRAGPEDRGRVAALGAFAERGLIRLGEPPASALAQYRAIEAGIPAPTLAPGLIDGTGEDEHVLTRGNAKTPGDPAPRRFLEAIAGAEQPTPATGSGRLELARRMADPANPLTARVLVNRLWKHHFGEGIVKSVDDFGVMGQAPSNPRLLDYLAARFLAEGWSIKRMHRTLLLSRAYQMASTPDPSADAVDPDNRLVHRMNVRRLEAEAVRDAILAASGRLDASAFGPGVPPHLTPFMEGRGRPGQSGPLDGEGRRSLYLNVRRNFLTPMLLAFDYPSPASSMGRRNVSNVPAQSLTMLNDPFVLDQARRWAERVLAEGEKPPEARVAALFQTAFGRPPTDAERSAALAFLDGQAATYGKPGDPRAWADLCHVLFNSKEFLYVN